MDLAMPGPERLSGEGVLSGAVPLVSHRWNGASLVDFPGLARVDHQNGTEVAVRNYRAISTTCPHRVLSSPTFVHAYPVVHTAQAAVEAALRSYHHPAPDPPRPPDNTSSSLPPRMYSQINRRGTGEFLAYVLSMWSRVHHTADVVFGSAHVHFVLRATSLAEGACLTSYTHRAIDLARCLTSLVIGFICRDHGVLSTPGAAAPASHGLR